MRTTRRFACTAALLLPGAALAQGLQLPETVALDACETPALHETLRDDLLRRAGPGPVRPAIVQDLAQARCPRCGCDLFASRSAPETEGELRNLF